MLTSCPLLCTPPAPSAAPGSHIAAAPLHAPRTTSTHHLGQPCSIVALRCFQARRVRASPRLQRGRAQRRPKGRPTGHVTSDANPLHLCTAVSSESVPCKTGKGCQETSPQNTHHATKEH
eukprot:870365-Rhodomonas_salina.2